MTQTLNDVPSMTQSFPTEWHDPHLILGLHTLEDGQKVIRLWRPGAEFTYIELFGQSVPLEKVDSAGMFEIKVPSHTTPSDYQVYYSDNRLVRDPYTFIPCFGEIDQYLFNNGVHYDLYRNMGGRPATHEGVHGTKFSVWAPSAKRVSVVGDFNLWNGLVHQMRCLGSCGVWELFLPGVHEGDRYKFELRTELGDIRLKADPYSLYNELRPATASIVTDINKFAWSDQDWMTKRAVEKNLAKPMNVYEVHLGSWKLRDGHFLNYREIAHELVDYCKKMSYTHVELLPISEHPYDESWGYQVTGYYAASSRFGSPSDFQYFVNHFHKNGLGVLIDWVPGHFPSDDFALAHFDGSSLYEHADEKQKIHPHWYTHIFNFGRKEVSNFLISSALFWLDCMHIDGLRVDAVASMLYLNYGREEGGWIPNRYGGHENLEAIEFLKHVNSIVHERFPGALTIAEESSSFLGVTHPLAQGGLGFDMKWNMGWMNDTLRYFSKDSLYRTHHHDDLTFGMVYAYSERFMLVLSHDEVVHGKRSLLSKMPGDMWQKFANLRLLLSYMMCQPGKKLLFMSNEIGQWNEWYCKQAVEWGLLEFYTHQGIQRMVQEVNHFYLEHAALWERDFDGSGFQWVDFSDRQNSVISYLRKSAHEELLCIHNFTPTYFHEYYVPLANVVNTHELFNSDAARFGGSGKHAERIEIVRNGEGRGVGLKVSLPPLATLILGVQFG